MFASPTAPIGETPPILEPESPEKGPRPWERPANILIALETKFDEASLAALCRDLSIEIEDLKGDDLKARKRNLVMRFEDEDQLDILEEAMKRAGSIRSLQKSLPRASKRSLTVFISYSHKDTKLQEELLLDLKALQDDGYIDAWYDGRILAGDEIDPEVERHLDRAHVILLLISRRFLGSSYIKEKEFPRAMKRHEAGEARVIPIIIRPAAWDTPPWKETFGRLKVLPKDGKAVTSWKDRQEAFVDVFKGVREVVIELSNRSIGEQISE